MNKWLWGLDLLPRVIVGIGIILAWTLAGRLIKSFMTSSLMRFFERTKTTLDDRMVAVTKEYVLPLFFLAGIYFGGGYVRASLTTANLLEHRVLDYINLGTYITLVLVATSLVVQVLKGLVQWYVEEVAMREEKRISPSVVPVFSKIASIVLFFLSLLIILDHLGVNIGGLVVSLGVGSLAVALAAQETISNLIGWFVIIIDQPFRLGDQVKLPTGEEGKIYQIGLRATRILNYDNNLVIIPNGELVKARIVNMSMPEMSARILIDLNVAYGTDLPKARRLVLEQAREHPGLLKEPAPEVYLINFNETGMMLRVMGRAPLATKFDTETRLREAIYRAFVENGIEIPIPQRIMKMVRDDGPETSQQK